MLTASYSAFSQADSTIQQLITQWRHLVSQVPTSPVVVDSNELNTLLRYVPGQFTHAGKYERYYNTAQMEYLKRDIGLNIQAGYLENFSPALEDVDDNVVYYRRAQAGVQWNILNNGFVESRSRIRELEYENQLLHLKEKTENSKHQYFVKWEGTMAAFNHSKLALLDRRKKILDALSSSGMQLHHLNLLSREDYLKTEARVAELQALYTVYGGFDKYTLSDGFLATIDAGKIVPKAIDYAALLANIHASADSTAHYIALIFDEKNHWTRTVSASVFTRYNLYDLTGAPPSMRSFGSAGVNISVPIRFRSKQQKILKNAWLEMEQQKNNEMQKGLHKQLATELYEYDYRLRQYVDLISKRKVFIELLRKDIARASVPGFNFNPYSALLLLDDITRIDIEMLDITQNITLRLIRINEYYKGNSPSDYLVDIPEQPENSATSPINAVYIWSKTLEKYGADYVVQYLTFTRFNTIVLAAYQNDPQAEIKKKLLALTDSLSIDGHLMLGDNKLINLSNSDFEKILTAIHNDYKSVNIKGIHLDIEPQTLPDYETRKTELLGKLVTLIQTANNYCSQQNLSLTVSIPLHYPQDIISAIMKDCHQVYFMAYENVKQEYILRKIQPWMNDPVTANKIVIASRTDDFLNPATLYEHQNKILNSAPGIAGAALHDLGRLIMMEENLIRVLPEKGGNP